MSDTVIRVEHLSKEYVLGNHGGSEGLRHAIHDFVTAPLRWLKNPDREALAAAGAEIQGRKAAETFWALKDVSFEIKQGEVVGIIGRNGAGKSTLLKILSRITEQTEGRVEITGRVASLLEVGTGFHPELSGRENIFLNGSILGMGRAEIKKKFDEIVAFAEVEKFLDTPVKRYSSGMYVRLAFAVAAHLEPEILIVDEVLAVGDAQFQKKCLGKIQSVSTQEGRTVLFVSHNLQTIRQLCQRVILFSQGYLITSGDPHESINRYMGQGAGCKTGAIDLVDYPRPKPADGARLLGVEFLDPDGRAAFRSSRDADLAVKIYFAVERPISGLDVAMAVVHVEGQRVFSESYSDQFKKMELAPGEYMVQFSLPLRFMKLESYFLVIGLYEAGKHCDAVENLPLPELVDETADPHLESQRWGFVRIPVTWTPVEARLLKGGT